MTLFNLIRANTASVGTGPVVIGLAVSGFLDFSSVTDGATVSYGIREGANSEVGRGVWTAATSTLTRDTILQSTNSALAITLAGSAEVFITALKEDFHDILAIGTANGLSLAGQALSLGLASSGVTGALSGTDWSTFNAKQSALTFPLASTLGGTGVNNAGTLTNASNTTITGGGTLALGGFTLTVPATGTAALLATANVFTTSQMIDMGADAIELRLQAHSTKTTNFLTFEKSDGTVWAGVDSAGRMFSYGSPAITSNTLIGGAGNATLTATNLVGIGFQALQVITNGGANFALGAGAMIAVTTGSQNVAIGVNSLQYGGLDNVAIGNEAARYVVNNTNVAIGSAALHGVFNATIIAQNVAIGNQAGFAVKTGANSNTMIGNLSGFALTTGAENIFIGNSSGRRQTTASNLFIIDDQDRATSAAEAQLAYLYGSMAAGGYLQLNIPTTTNNAVKDTLKLQAYVSTASTGAANGFGVGLPFLAETATDATYQQQGLISTSWIDATNASRKAKMSLSAYDTAARLGIEIEASGTVAKLGFFGAATVVQPTAYTQTYATASKTNPTATAANLATTASTQTTPWGFASQAQADDIATQANKMQTDYINLQKLVNSLIDDLQALGLVL